MCGIWALIGQDFDSKTHEPEFMKIVGRGPDLTVVSEARPGVWLGFHRLAIVEPGHAPSEQPIVAGGLSVVCNGEIYNHLSLKEQSGIQECEVKNGASDCAAIIHSFKFNNGNLKKTCASLDGVFAFIMADDKYVYVGRDPIGVRPLFYGYTAEGALVFGSEVKSIEKLCVRLDYFPPGCCAQIPIPQGVHGMQDVSLIVPQPFQTPQGVPSGGQGYQNQIKAVPQEFQIMQYYSVPTNPETSVVLPVAQVSWLLYDVTSGTKIKTL